MAVVTAVANTNTDGVDVTIDGLIRGDSYTQGDTVVIQEAGKDYIGTTAREQFRYEDGTLITERSLTSDLDLSVPEQMTVPLNLPSTITELFEIPDDKRKVRILSDIEFVFTWLTLGQPTKRTLISITRIVYKDQTKPSV